MKAVSKATILALLAAAIVFLTPAPAQADSYLDYQVSGIFQSGSALSGWFVVDTTNGRVTNGQLTADNQTFSCPDGFSNGCALSSAVGFLVGPGAPTSYSFLQLVWLPGSDVSGFNFNTSNSYCWYCGANTVNYLTSGSAVEFGTLATPVFTQQGPVGGDEPNDGPVPTPEPNSGILLAAGLLGLSFMGLKYRGATNNA
jgi:hypothetical protein